MTSLKTWAGNLLADSTTLRATVCPPLLAELSLLTRSISGGMRQGLDQMWFTGPHNHASAVFLSELIRISLDLGQLLVQEVEIVFVFLPLSYFPFTSSQLIIKFIIRFLQSWKWYFIQYSRCNKFPELCST